MTKKQNIIRVAKKRENPYVMLDKLFLENSTLSWKAKGLLAYLLSKPDDWRIIIGDLVNRSKDGRDSVLSGLNELINEGYVLFVQHRDDKGRFSVGEYLVFERPQDKEDIEENKNNECDKKEEDTNPTTARGLSVNGFSVYGKSDSGKPAPTNNDITNNELTNKNNVVVDEPKNFDFAVDKKDVVAVKDAVQETKGIILPDTFIIKLLKKYTVPDVLHKVYLVLAPVKVKMGYEGLLIKALEEDWRPNSIPAPGADPYNNKAKKRKNTLPGEVSWGNSGIQPEDYDKLLKS